MIAAIKYLATDLRIGYIISLFHSIYSFCGLQQVDLFCFKVMSSPDPDRCPLDGSLNFPRAR